MRNSFRWEPWALLLLAVFAAFRLTSPRPSVTHAQQIELACPAGTQPIQGGGATTVNQVTGGIRRNWCVDINGNVVSVTATINTGKLNGVCIVDGSTNLTLAAAITCAGTTGVVEIPMFSVPTFTTATIPVGVTLRFDGTSCLNNSGTLTINGPIVAPPVQIFCGAGTIAAGGLANPLHALWFPGADIIAQTGNAYTAEVISGGTILIDAQSSGACWTSNSTANLTTLGKYVTIQGTVPPSDSNAQVTRGSCILYTHISANTAFVLDWTPSAGGGYMPAAGFRDIALLNTTTEGGATECRTAGGCGSAATGISIGPVNGGAHDAEFSNVLVEGFGTGINVPDAAGVSWGMVFRHVSLIYNTTAYLQAKAEEGINFRESVIAVNGTGMQFTAGAGDLTFTGGSIDSNTICGIDTTTSSNELSFFGTHWENLNVAGNVCYVKGGSATINIYGGLALNDNNSGSSTAWFTASTFEVHGLTLFSSGATLTGRVFTANGQADISVFDNSTTPIPLANVIFLSTGVRVTVISAGNPPFLAAGSSACTNGELVLSAGWGASPTVTGVVGTSVTCEWTITSAGAGQAANPTITDTLVNALPAATTVCEMRMVGGTGATTLIDQTTLSATAPIFTFGGTPVAASTYKVLRRCGP